MVVIVIGTVAVHELIVLVTMQEYVPAEVATKFTEFVCVHEAVVFVAVMAVTVIEGEKQVKLPLNGLMVYVGASVKLAIDTMVEFRHPNVSTTVTV